MGMFDNGIVEEEKKTSEVLVRSRTTCIVGGGNSAHVLIPLLSEAGHHVHLLTRRPNDWHDIVYCKISDSIAGDVSATHVGRIDKKSSSAADVIPDADIIILCMPVHQYRPALNRIAPFIRPDKEVFLGTIYGQGGFGWMVHSDVVTPFALEYIVTFAIGSIPWICRNIEYGKIGANYGTKEVNLVAVTPADRFDKLNGMLLEDISYRPFHRGRFRQTCSFLSLTMSVDNQIIHPARSYGLWKKSNGGVWPSSKDVPYFYRDFDEPSASIMTQLDHEYSKVRAAIRKQFPERPFAYMLSYLEMENLNHNSVTTEILPSLRESEQLASIKTPVVEGRAPGSWKLDTDCRFFTDDIPYGLLIAKWIGEKLHVNTPMIDEVIAWAQGMRNEAFLIDGKINKDYCLSGKYVSGIPESYGINNISDILD